MRVVYRMMCSGLIVRFNYVIYVCEYEKTLCQLIAVLYTMVDATELEKPPIPMVRTLIVRLQGIDSRHPSSIGYPFHQRA